MSAESTEEESVDSADESGDGVDGDTGTQPTDEATAEAAEDEPPEAESRQKGPDEMFCTSCGAAIKKRAERCPKCGVPTEGISGGISTAGASSAAPTSSAGTTGGSASGKTKYTVGGIVSGLVGFLLLPIVFGPIAVYCGYQVYQHHDETHGIALMAWGGLSLVVGMAVGVMMFT